MAYIWGKTSKIPDYLTAGRTAENISKDIANSLTHGKEINSNNIKYIMLMSNTQLLNKAKIFQWDVLNETIGVPLVNQKVLDILSKECVGKFQAIPAVIQLPDGSEINDYFVINVIHKVPVASLENCILGKLENERKTPEPIGPWTFFDKEVYKAKVVDQEDLCKDSTIGANLIFLSERLYQIFKKEKIRGGGFYTNLRDSVIFV